MAIREIITAIMSTLLSLTGSSAKAIPPSYPVVESTPNDVVKVLGENTENNFYFTVNAPAIFKQDLVAPNVIYSLNNGNGISITSGQDPTINNTGVLSLQGSTGVIVLSAGTGITIDGLKLTNSDLGSAQNIFKTFSVSGQSDVTSDSNSDSLTLEAGGGVTITTDATTDKIIITSATPNYSLSGWTDSGTSVFNSTLTDKVGIGTSSPTSLLHVVGSSAFAGGVTLGGATTDAITFAGRIANGNSILPSVDLGSDLGSSSYRFNNLWVANINSNSSQSFSGQTTFSYAPTDSSLSQSSVLINPTTSADNGQLLGLSIAGYQRALIDKEGDLTLGYSGNVSAPESDNPLNIYNHAATQSAFITTAGKMYLAGNLGIGTTNPAAKLHIVGSSDSVQQIIKGYSSQTANLQEWQNSSGSILSYINKDGKFTLKNNVSLNLEDSAGSARTGLLVGTNNILQIGSTALTDVYINTESYSGALIIKGTSGNVGIGITNPSQKLSVVGNIRTSNGTSTVNLTPTGIYGYAAAGDTPPSPLSIMYSNGVSNGAGMTIGPVSTGIDLYGGAYNLGGDVSIHTWDGLAAGTHIERLTVKNATGFVGIGTTNPATKLDIAGAGSSVIRFTRNDGTTAAGSIDMVGSDGLVDSRIAYNQAIWQGLEFYTGGVSVDKLRLLITDSGYVGIGTTNPATNTEIAINTSSTTNILRLTNAGQSVSTGVGLEFYNALGQAEQVAQIYTGVGSGYTNNHLTIQVQHSAEAVWTFDKDGNITFSDVNNNKSIGMARQFAAGTPGRDFTVYAGGTAANQTNQNGGNLILASGLSTGSGGSNIYLKTSGNGSTGTSDNALVTAATITSSGNVGIGTTNPAALLHVGTNAALPLPLRVDNSVNGEIFAVTYSADNGLARLKNSAGDIKVKLDSASSSYFTGGNVGIGITNPAAKLSFVQDTVAAGGIDFGGDTNLYRVTANALKTDDVFQTASGFRGSSLQAYGGNDSLTLTSKGTGDVYLGNEGNTHMTILDGGNVGIGITTPIHKLQVIGDIAVTTGYSLRFNNDLAYITYQSGSGGAAYNYANFYKSYNSHVFDTHNIGSSTNGYAFKILGSEKMNIDTLGNVGIGTTTPTAKLHVSGGVTGKALSILDDTGDQAIFTASASGVTKLTISHYGLLNATAGGLATFIKAGTISDADFTDTAVDGLIGVDSTNNKMYIRSGGLWKFIAFTGGFQIPKEESVGLIDGDFLMPYVEKHLADGSLHGLYSKFSDVKGLLFSEETESIRKISEQLSVAIPATETATLSQVNGLSTSVNTLFSSLENVGHTLQNVQKSISDLALEFWTKKSHQETLCVGANDDETCLSKDQIDQLIKLIPTPTEIMTPTPSPEPTLSISPTPTATESAESL